MSIKRVIPILTLSVALIPASLAAQTADAQIQGALDQALDAGIPTSLLESKVAEGEAKGIPMNRIAEAVQRKLDGLSRAQDALAGVPDVGPDDLAVGADALESGVSEAVLAELAETAPTERRAAAVAALTYLVNAEVVPEEALIQVQDALARGPAALEDLPAQAQVPGEAGPPADIPGGGNVSTEVGPPSGIPAPGNPPAGSVPAGVEPPTDIPGAPSNLPGPGSY